jgi:hypothetical protein
MCHAPRNNLSLHTPPPGFKGSQTGAVVCRWNLGGGQQHGNWWAQRHVFSGYQAGTAASKDAFHFDLVNHFVRVLFYLIWEALEFCCLCLIAVECIVKVVHQLPTTAAYALVPDKDGHCVEGALYFYHLTTLVARLSQP